MIRKRELLDFANTAGLLPNVVEKDYALGWALAGIFSHEELADSWVFKGGTCLKKCYFETYRFSEDLDFTLKDDGHLNQDFLQRVFAEISEWIYEQSGLEFPADSQDFEIYDNPRGNPNCLGKLSYRGPISPSSGGLPRIKLDLTADERLVLPPVHLSVFHSYTDAPDGGIEVQAYAYEEAFGEKVRALAERARPRDLYDVVNLYRNTDARPAASIVRDVLNQKCEFKGIPLPNADALEEHRTMLESGWERMLAHQLPALPPVASFWEALPEFFDWLYGKRVPVSPAAYQLGHGERIIREQTSRLPVGRNAQSHLEVIRFAAANRLCVELVYQGSKRLIEPYSLRRTQDDNIILHAWNRDRNGHRSYRIDRIQGARVTDQIFAPRYAVELTPAGPVPIQDTQRSPDTRDFRQPVRRRAARRATRQRSSLSTLSFSQVPTYIYECGMCGKKFRRKKMSGKLNKHKTPDGFPCGGRTGFLVDTKY